MSHVVLSTRRLSLFSKGHHTFRFYLTKFIKVAWRVNSTSLQYFSGEELLSLYYYIHLENGTDDPINFRPKHHNKFNGKSLKQNY